MEVTRKYVDFILENIVKDSITVQLYEPCEDGKRMYVKLGPAVHCKVNIKVLEKYTRSAKLKLTFDKYEVEEIFFIPYSSSPDSIDLKTRNKIEKIVNNTFTEDNRAEDIKEMYVQRSKMMFSGISRYLKELKKDDDSQILP